MNRPTFLIPAILACAIAPAQAYAADQADNILPQVKNILLESNGCTEQFETALEGANYTVVTNRSLADAIFKIDIQRLDESLGAAMRYAVSLQRPGGYELFGQSGAEDSTDETEVCEDISEDMVEALVERSSAIP